MTLLSIKPEKFIQCVLKMHWLLFEAPENTYFFISNKPIIRFNRFQNGANGYNSKGIEIYIPISSRFYIVLFDRNFIHPIPSLDYHISPRLFDFIDGNSDKETQRAIEKAVSLRTVIRSHTALNIINTLQVEYGDEIYCANRDFLKLKTSLDTKLK